MHKCATIQNSILIPVIYACFASGSFVSSILLEFGHTDKTHSKNPFQSFNVIESMQVQTRYPANILLTISAAFQLSTLYPVYALWKSTAADPNREEYEDLATPAAKNLIGVFMLTSIMGFFVNSLRNIFPYYMFAYMNEESSVIYYVTFMV
uniref:Uncharacterized protein n=1 Tax=Acrobeloides nanus TaxID=290746 RepID=A0A914E8R0_9BILA